MPDLFAKDHPAIFVVLVKIAWIGITLVALVAPLQAFREFVVVSDEGLLKSTPFRPVVRLGWKEIIGVMLKLDDNSVVFTAQTPVKFKMSLCYDGWEEFREYARKHLDAGMNFVLASALEEVSRKTPAPLKR